MSTAPIDVSIVLVSWNTRELLLACLESLPAAVGPLQADVWVVDNGSTDGSVAAVRSWRPTNASLAVHVIENGSNAGFAAANNQAIVCSEGRYVLLLNSDTVALPGSIERLVNFAAEHPGAGMVGAMLLNPDGSFQGSFADFPSLRSELLNASGTGGGYSAIGIQTIALLSPRSLGPSIISRAPACWCAAWRSRRWACSTKDYFMYNEEPDWCLRMRRVSWATWYAPDAQIIHYGGQSTRQVRHAMVQALYRSKVRFFRKHYGRLPAIVLQASFVAVLRIKWAALALLAALRPGLAVGPPIHWRDLRSITPTD